MRPGTKLERTVHRLHQVRREFVVSWVFWFMVCAHCTGGANITQIRFMGNCYDCGSHLIPWGLGGPHPDSD